jgi:lysophospholipase L1-like esterase
MKRTDWLGSIVLVVFVIICVIGSGGLTGMAAATTCHGASDATPALRIVVLGDSIAAGWPLDPPDRWSDTIQTTLQAARPERCVEVRNVAMVGSRIGYLESSIAAQADLATFQVAIIFEGVNDGGITAIDEWERRYAVAVQALEARGLTVIVATAPPLFVNNEFEGTFDELAAAQRSIAGRSDQPILDIERDWRDRGSEEAAGYYVDIIHPNAAGQAAIAAVAARLILTLPEAGGS